MYIYIYYAFRYVQTKKVGFISFKQKQLVNQNIQTRDKIYCRFVLSCVGFHFRTPSNQRVLTFPFFVGKWLSLGGVLKKIPRNRVTVTDENMSKDIQSNSLTCVFSLPIGFKPHYHR